MGKSRFARLIDAFFVSFIIFFLTMILLTKFNLTFTTRLLSSSFVSTISFCIINKKAKQKHMHSLIRLSEEKHLKNCILTLDISNTSTKNAFLTNLFKSYTNSKGYKNFGFYYDLLSRETDKKTINEVINKAKNKKSDIYFIITNSLTIDAKELLEYYKNQDKNTKIKIVTPQELYLIMKQTNYYSCDKDTKLYSSNLSKNIKTIFKTTISKNSSLKFLCLGLLIFFTSYFIPYRNYYQIVSIILLLLSLIGLTTSLFKTNTQT